MTIQASNSTLINHNGVPLHHSRLKVRAVCTLMRNMSVKKGLIKNAQVIIDQLHHCFIRVHVMNNLTGILGEPISLPHIHFEFMPLRLTWTIQRLAYATTFQCFHGIWMCRTPRSDIDNCTLPFCACTTKMIHEYWATKMHICTRQSTKISSALSSYGSASMAVTVTGSVREWLLVIICSTTH